MFYFSCLDRNNDDTAVVLTGILFKRGAVHKAFKKRWFLFQASGTMYYYANPNMTHMKGSFSVADCVCEVVSPEELAHERINHRKNVFKVEMADKSRTFYLQARNEVDMLEWVEAITKIRDQIQDRELRGSGEWSSRLKAAENNPALITSAASSSSSSSSSPPPPSSYSSGAQTALTFFGNNDDERILCIVGENCNGKASLLNSLIGIDLFSYEGKGNVNTYVPVIIRNQRGQREPKLIFRNDYAFTQLLIHVILQLQKLASRNQPFDFDKEIPWHGELLTRVHELTRFEECYMGLKSITEVLELLDDLFYLCLYHPAFSMISEAGGLHPMARAIISGEKSSRDYLPEVLIDFKYLSSSYFNKQHALKSDPHRGAKHRKMATAQELKYSAETTQIKLPKIEMFVAPVNEAYTKTFVDNLLFSHTRADVVYLIQEDTLSPASSQHQHQRHRHRHQQPRTMTTTSPSNRTPLIQRLIEGSTQKYLDRTFIVLNHSIQVAESVYAKLVQASMTEDNNNNSSSSSSTTNNNNTSEDSGSCNNYANDSSDDESSSINSSSNSAEASSTMIDSHSMALVNARTRSFKADLIRNHHNTSWLLNVFPISHMQQILFTCSEKSLVALTGSTHMLSVDFDQPRWQDKFEQQHWFASLKLYMESRRDEPFDGLSSGSTYAGSSINYGNTSPASGNSNNNRNSGRLLLFRQKHKSTDITNSPYSFLASIKQEDYEHMFQQSGVFDFFNRIILHKR